MITPDHPVDRLLAGGRHIRLLIAGQTPAELALAPLDRFERVVQVVRLGEMAPGRIVADPLRLPFTEALFDRIVTTTVLPEVQARAELRELWRVLAPAGLVLLVVKARRRWQLKAPGWHRDALDPLLADAMFEVLDWRVEVLPERWHLILVGKVDGLAPQQIGRVIATRPSAVPQPL